MLRFWLFLLISTSLWAEAKTFRFIWEKDDVLIVDKYQDIRTHEPGGQTTSREEKNRIVLKVTEVDAAGAVMAGGFDTYSRSPRLVGNSAGTEISPPYSATSATAKQLSPTTTLCRTCEACLAFLPRPSVQEISGSSQLLKPWTLGR